MELSIIVITKDDDPGVRRTLGSVSTFINHPSVEIVIQDGGSSQHVVSALARDFGRSVSLASARDRGIYSGMNAGLDRSSGRWVWFLNGGDRCKFNEANKVVRILEQATDSEVLFFDYLLTGANRSIERSAKPAWYLRHGLPTSHQAMIYPGQVARAMRYDETFHFAGDFEFTARIVREASLAMRHVPIVLSEFELGGTSTTHSRETLQEASRVQAMHFDRSRISRTVSRVAFEAARLYRRSI